MDNYTDLVDHNGSFYAHCWREDESNGIVCFTIPLEGNGSAVAPNPIPMLFAPFPFREQNLQCLPVIKICGSRLLLIAAQWMPVQVEQADEEGEPVQLEQDTGEGDSEVELEGESEEEDDLGVENEEELEVENEEELALEWESDEEEEVHPVRGVRLREVEKELVITL
jgi:hypothetical protein